MKKVLFILLGILCALSAGATKYGTLYRGSGRGFIYTISSSHNSAASAGLAPAPVAAMGSVSRGVSAGVSSRGVAPVRTMVVAMPAVSPVHGIYTAASAVSGGVTTYDKAPLRPRGGVRKAGEPGWSGEPSDEEDESCPYCIDLTGPNGEPDGICDRCGCDLSSNDGCTCDTDPYGPGYCWCPLELNWGAMVFLMLLAVGYGVRAGMREKCTMKENENRA